MPRHKQQPGFVSLERFAAECGLSAGHLRRLAAKTLVGRGLARKRRPASGGKARWEVSTAYQPSPPASNKAVTPREGTIKITVAIPVRFLAGLVVDGPQRKALRR